MQECKEYRIRSGSVPGGATSFGSYDLGWPRSAEAQRPKGADGGSKNHEVVYRPCLAEPKTGSVGAKSYSNRNVEAMSRLRFATARLNNLGATKPWCSRLR